MKKMVFYLFVLVLGICSLPSAMGEIKLPALIADHMVLQRDTKVRIWGWSEPEEKVIVRFNGQQTLTTGAPDGTWSVTLKPMRAGGPYDMTISGRNTIKIKDVLVGEVWVASGQSNMEMLVVSSANFNKESAAADYPEIRHFTVTKRPIGAPTDLAFGQWVVCQPNTVGSFSGVGYFFARFLHQELNVPVGIINSSWGGTPAETWTPLAALKAEKINVGLVDQYEKTLPKYAEAKKEYEAKLAERERLLKEGKLRERHLDEGNKGFDLGWAKADFKTADWKPIDLPGSVDNMLDGDGAIWVRRTIDIPAEWAGHELALNLGTVDDYDVAYWNGVKIGETNAKTNPNDWWIHSRTYIIPGKLVTAGSAVVAVRIFDDFGNGGITSAPEKMFLEDTATKKQIPLAGSWCCKVETSLSPALLASAMSLAFGPDNPNAPGTLYNGMIYPLRNYKVRGAIWYQGESNAGLYGEYTKLLSTMIDQWRKTWNNPDLAFGIVQLANFMAVQPDANVDSAWAHLRDTQREVSQTVPGTGLALAIDIGDAGNIHPTNKQEVGRRLGLWAMAKVYGKKDVVYSGPMYKSMKVEGDKIRLAFDHLGGGLVAKGDKLTGFAIAGADGKYVWADAKIDGDTVVVSANAVKTPVSVRYAWADNPICNLYNKAGLPAVPFQTVSK